MGTNVRGVLLSVPASSAEIVRAVMDSSIPDGRESVVLHVFPGESHQTRFVWTELTDDHNRDIGADEELARIFSAAIAPTVFINYSDMSGADEYRGYRAGAEERAGPSAQVGVAALFPFAVIRDGDELFEFVYESTGTAESFLLSKAGKRLITPEPWSPPAQGRVRANLLDHEFEALRPLRRVFIVSVYLFGSLVVLGILFVLGQFVFEILR
jgi:hypothetical protein